MDWFKHKTGSLDDPDLADAVDKYGDAAYLFFFGVLEIYGREFSRLKDGWLIISLTFLRRKLRKSSAKVEQMLNVYREKNRILSEISGDAVRIKIPKFIELASDWSGRYARKVSATPTEAPTEAPTAIEVEREVEREVDKDKSKSNTIAPSDKNDRSGATATPPSKPKISIPKIGFDFEKRTWVGITKDDYSDWEAAFPAVNIDVELSRMIAWLLANPEKRKLRYRKFITNWLSRTQDRGGSWKK